MKRKKTKKKEEFGKAGQKENKRKRQRNKNGRNGKTKRNRKRQRSGDPFCENPSSQGENSEHFWTKSWFFLSQGPLGPGKLGSPEPKAIPKSHKEPCSGSVLVVGASLSLTPVLDAFKSGTTTSALPLEDSGRLITCQLSLKALSAHWLRQLTFSCSYPEDTFLTN